MQINKLFNLVQHLAVTLYEQTVKTVQNLQKYNRYNVVLFLLIVGVGMVFLASASVYESYKEFGNSYGYLFKQFIWLFLSISMLFVIYNIPLSFWYRLRYLLLVASFLLVVIPLIQQNTINGSNRWLSVFGIRVQSVDWSRWMFLAFVAATCCDLFSKAETKYIVNYKKLALLAVVVIIYMGILWAQPSFSMAMIIFLVVLFLLFLSGLSWLFLTGLLLTGLGAAAVGVLLSGYRLARFGGFFDPNKYANSLAYQPIKSEQAIASGSFFGKGLGYSTYKLGKLPAAHNDFILAIVFEEMGLFVTIIFIVSVLFLFFRLFFIAAKSLHKDLFAGLFGCGLILVLILNCIVNIGFISALLPVTGLPFPLLSYGGSFMFYVLFSIAIVLRVEYEQKIRHQ